MNLNDLAVFRMMNGKMQWLAQRQRVLAQNIANADTPGYQPNDVKPIDFSRPTAGAPFRLQLARTSNNHLPGMVRHTELGIERKDRHPLETSPTGNGVILEDQQIKVADTLSSYELVTNLYRKHVGMFHTALGRGAQR